MQPNDVYGSSPTREPVSPGWAGRMNGERQLNDYVSDIGGTVSSRVGQIAGFISERPLLAGSLAAGAVGAFAGRRIAQMIAMRRRKTAYERAFEMLGILMATIGSMTSRGTTSRAANRLADAGKNIAGSAQDLRDSAMKALPVVSRPKMEQPSTIKQVGYGISLIPVTLALVRNPLIRDVGFRFLARRFRRR